MPKRTEKKVKFIHPGFNPTNFGCSNVVYPGQDFSNGTVMTRHMEREGNGLKIVEDGYVDKDALIQSEKKNAGLENIIRLQTMRYGTIENAILRNKDKQMYADVSHIPTNISDQTEYVKSIQADVDALCLKLGISKEELLKTNQQTLADMLAKKTTSQSDDSNGGNE